MYVNICICIYIHICICICIYSYLHRYIYTYVTGIFQKRNCFGFFSLQIRSLAAGGPCHFNLIIWLEDWMILSPALEGCWIFLKKMESRFISNSSYPRSGVIFLCFPKYQVFSWVFFPSKKNMESSSGNFSLLCPEASPETQKAMMALMMKTSLSFQFG